MRKYYPEILMALILCAALGVVCLRKAPDVPETQVLAAAPELSEPLADEAQTVRLLADGEVTELSLHDYLIGVLMAEVPMDFEPEALRAQAVASRTYALHCVKHDGADVCADSGCCQAWREPQGEASCEKARAAVEATDGKVLCYGGELIDATFFSCSGGMTEDALAVWGAQVPYLQSVESPGEEQAAAFHSEAVFTPEEFAARLPGAELTGDPAGWLGEEQRTEGGGVASMEIGDMCCTGTELRRIFSLRSTRFDLTYRDGSFCFDVYGSGHRVGLSQYGAQAMAQSGADYAEILHTYYTGAEITEME